MHEAAATARTVALAALEDVEGALERGLRLTGVTLLRGANALERRRRHKYDTVKCDFTGWFAEPIIEQSGFVGHFDPEGVRVSNVVNYLQEEPS